MNTVISKLIPIFILAFLGYTAGKTRLLTENTGDVLCSFLFYFCGPSVSFSNIITSDPGSIFNIRFALALIVFEMSVFALLILLNKYLFHMNGTEIIIHSVCSFYGNISYVGIPVFLTLFNNVIPNIITLLVHGILTFPLAVFLLDWFTGKETKGGASHAVISAFKNPNIFIPLFAVLLLFLKIQIPQVISDTAELLGRPTTPAGMFALGLTCAKSGRKISSPGIFINALLSALFKLIVCPVIAWCIGKYLFRLDHWWLTSLTIISMLPAALNDYILSQRYHSEETFASLSVLLSNLLFSITISLYIMVIGL